MAILQALRKAVYKPDDVPKPADSETPVWSTLDCGTCYTELFDHSEGKHFEKHGREGLDAPQGRSGVGTNVSTLYFVCDNLDVGLG